MAYSGQCIVMCLSSVYVYEYACVISASRHLLKYTYFHSTEVLGDDLYLPLGGSLSGNDDADDRVVMKVGIQEQEQESGTLKFLIKKKNFNKNKN